MDGGSLQPKCARQSRFSPDAGARTVGEYQTLAAAARFIKGEPCRRSLWV
jgi:hypothetical protein